MAVDMFLKLDGIPGESADDAHKSEIDILAWSWGMSQSGTMHIGGGGGSGKANFQDLSITKFVDIASPELVKFCSKGSHIKKGWLYIRKAAGDTPLEYMIYNFEDLIISSVSTGGSGGEDRLTENISLNFRKWWFKYTQQKETGAEGDKKDFGFNIAEYKQWSGAPK